MTTTDTADRVHLSVAEAHELSDRAMRGIGDNIGETWILDDQLIDAALCVSARRRLATIQFDRSGTRHIGRYVINHSSSCLG